MGRTSDVPLVGFAHSPVPISVQHVDGSGVTLPRVRGAHAHDFLMLVHIVRGACEYRVDGRTWDLREGDAFVIAPGAVVDHAAESTGPPGELWSVLFPAEAVAPASWRDHPLLAPFVGRHRGGGQRIAVPSADRATWRSRFADLDDELSRRRDGHAEAARAHLTLLLVALGRLVDDVPAESGDPLLAAVFALVEERFAGPLSLRDVAAVVGLTPGHLTTVVRRGTGRTVQQWITERRLREARRLLTSTDLPVADIGVRVGYPDPGYFARRFRAAHGSAPATWRAGPATP
ncbi:AraC family transcriptional regulator [Pseudonocardia sp. ICBG1293]|uniref:AraC family transcriptional regulator n=1 Tax=Pseudonocardia sp. ICBG1293 TaxID=2844382 RepID=UPI001CC9A49B|nr:AraC family transcriptional regulator [Pseudonocardia sp. ICBG1293]